MASRTESLPTMSVNNKRVFYVKYLAHEIYADILRARPDVRLDRLENESTDEIAAPVLAAAHAYQIGAARDELARDFYVDARLLRRVCWSSISPAATPTPWPNTRWECCSLCRNESSRPIARCAARPM